MLPGERFLSEVCGEVISGNPRCYRLISERTVCLIPVHRIYRLSHQTLAKSSQVQGHPRSFSIAVARIIAIVMRAPFTQFNTIVFQLNSMLYSVRDYKHLSRCTQNYARIAIKKLYVRTVL